MKEKKKPGKYERREFIKQTGKVGLGAAVYGGAGYLTGKTYKTGRDFYREDVKPYVNKGKEIIDKSEEGIKSIKETGKSISEGVSDWFTKNFQEDKYNERIKEREEKERQEEAELERKKRIEEIKKTSRRGFFSKYFHIFNENPVATGTVTGASLGALVKTLTLYPQYIEKKKVAKLRDEHVEYGKKIEILEDYKEKLEKASAENDKKIKGLEDELRKIHRSLGTGKENDYNLEEKLEERNIQLPVTMIVSGLILIFSFFILNGINYTGFLTLSKDSIATSNFLGVVVLFIAIVLILIGIIRIRKIEKLIKYKDKKRKIK